MLLEVFVKGGDKRFAQLVLAALGPARRVG